MPSLLEKIREKPESVRVRYLFLSVGISFLFVLVIWSFSLRTSLKTLDYTSEDIKSVAAPVRPVVDNAADSLETLIKTGETLKDTLKDTSKEGVAGQKKPYSPTPNTVDKESQNENFVPEENVGASPEDDPIIPPAAPREELDQ